MDTHYERVKGAWEERFERRYGFWRGLADGVVARYLDCGVWQSGFARVRCRKCPGEFLVAFSCKGRGLCPSCGAKRAAEVGAFLLDEVVETDGPDLPPDCDEGFGLSFENDVWALYLPSQTGTATVSTCNAADYDTRLAAYTGSCGALELIGCNDDGMGCGLTSELQIPVTQGTLVLVRVGAYGDDRGPGTVTISVE